MIQINRYKTAIDHGNAYWMARLAKVAYTRHEDGSPHEAQILAELQAEDPRFISVTGTSKNSAQAILVEHQLYLTLAFRGTDETLDWVDNIDVRIEEEGIGKFHSGFLSSLNDVWQPLWDKYLELKKLSPAQTQVGGVSQHARPLFLTGHSLGGGMATVAAARLLSLDLPFISAYTFGQPRAVFRETKIAFDMMSMGRFHRFQNNTDIVTRVPSRLRGYTHVGQCIYISQEGELYNDTGFWFRFLDTIDSAIESAKNLKLDIILDHNMDSYLLAIKAWNAKFRE